MIIGIASWDDGAGTVSVTDNASGGSNTYTLETDVGTDINGQKAGAFHCGNIHGSPTVVTLTLSGAEIARSIAIDEFSGQLQQNDARDGTAHGGQAQTNPATTTDAVTSGTFTTSTDGDLIWGGTADSSSSNDDASVGTNFTLGTKETPGTVVAGLHTEYRTQTSAASGTAATFTNNVSGDDYITFMIAIKPTANDPPFSVRRADQPDSHVNPPFPVASMTATGQPPKQGVLPQPQLMGQMVM